MGVGKLMGRMFASSGLFGVLGWLFGSFGTTRYPITTRRAQFAGSSSVPAHVEMIGFLGMGNNPMVGATVAVAVGVAEALNK